MSFSTIVCFSSVTASTFSIPPLIISLSSLSLTRLSCTRTAFRHFPLPPLFSTCIPCCGTRDSNLSHSQQQQRHSGPCAPSFPFALVSFTTAIPLTAFATPIVPLFAIFLSGVFSVFAPLSVLFLFLFQNFTLLHFFFSFPIITQHKRKKFLFLPVSFHLLY